MSETPLQILAAILASLILGRALPPASFFIDFLQASAWLVGP
jgi:uncharacterized membrane protein YwzB